MHRLAGWLLLAGCVVAAVTGAVVSTAESLLALGTVEGVSVAAVLSKGLFATAVVFGLWGSYLLVSRALGRTISKRRAHDLRNVLRLVFGALGIVALLGVLTDQWLGVLLSLGVVGFAITFALQQPLLSLLGWATSCSNSPTSSATGSESAKRRAT